MRERSYRMVTITKTMRYKIIKPVGMEWDTFKEIYNTIEDKVCVAKNLISSLLWEQNNPHFSFRYRFREKLTRVPYAEIAGKSQQADISGLIKSLVGVVTRDVVDECYTEVNSAYSGERGKNVFTGKSPTPTYRADTSIPFRASACRTERDNKGVFLVSVSLINREYARTNEVPSRLAVQLSAKGSSRSIINRIHSGEYKLLGSNFKRKDRDYYVNLTYSYESVTKHNVELSPNRVMGIDIGVVNAAVLAYNHSDDRFYIEGSEIRSFRARTEARRNQLLRQYKYAGSRKGHGRVTALKPIEKLRDKVANFRATTNHRYAKKIVEEAIKHGCGVIQMEDLSGISTDDRFLKTWTYYDLQEKIRYKAEAVGIEVRKIDPKHTSQRCSKCGHIAQGNRDISKGQSKFKCTAYNCNYEANADYNAARNIATPGIEEIIKRKLERKKQALKMAE